MTTEGPGNTRNRGLNWVSNMIYFHDPKIITIMIKMTRYFYPGSSLTRFVQSTCHSDFSFSTGLNPIIKLITISKTTRQ